MISIRETILEHCFEPYTGSFRGGQSANNKLNIEILEHNVLLADVVTSALGRMCAQHFQPDFVVGVPNGANWLAARIADKFDLGNIVLLKPVETDSEGETPRFEDELDEQFLRTGVYRRGVIIEDVFNRFTSTREVLGIPALREKVVGAAAVWDRGNRLVRGRLPIPYLSLVEEPIPAQLDQESELWEYAK